MFDFLRRRGGQTLTVYILFGAIIVVFVFWGIRHDNVGGIANYAASVNGQFISLGEYSRIYEQQSQLLTMMGGGELDAQRRTRFRAELLNRLIGSEMVSQASEKEGISISDEEIRDQILNIKAFQDNGRFRRESYQAFLGQKQITAGQFESEIRRDLRISQVRTLFYNALSPSQLDIQKEAQIRGTQIKVDFLVWDSEGSAQSLKVADSEVQAYLSKTENQKSVEDYFKTNSAQFTTPEEARARHILAKFEAGKADSEAAALKKIEAAKARLDKGEPFEKVAKEVSDDTGSQSKGGDLGSFTRGRMVPEFEQAVFAANPGQKIGPIKTGLGFHLIEVLDKKPQVVESLEKARPQIARELIARQRSSELSRLAEEALSKKDSGALNQLASRFGLKWESTDYFTPTSPTIPKVGSSEDFMTVAFSLNSKNPLPTRLVRDGSRVFLVKFQGETTAKSEDVLALEQGLTQQRAMDSLEQWQSEIAKKTKIRRNEALINL